MQSENTTNARTKQPLHDEERRQLEQINVGSQTQVPWLAPKQKAIHK
jgi:hypothetical protein